MRNNRAIWLSAALCAGIFCGGRAWADNITVSDAKLAAPVKGTHGTVRFNVQWEHSWRLDLPGTNRAEPYNYDAAWVFVKYRAGNGEWKHATLSTNAADHVVPAGVALSVGQTDGKGIGVFLYRSANGAGTFKADNVGLRWLYPSNGIGDSAAVTVKVFAIEMVYVSQGPFWVGDGQVKPPNIVMADSQFYAGGGAHPPYNPLLITNENEMAVGDSAGQLCYIPQKEPNSLFAHSGDGLGPRPAVFPKGYAAFYGMKYEITQGAYVDFLNTLSVAQATNRWPFMNDELLRKDLAFGYAHRYAITNTSGVCSLNLLRWVRSTPASPDSVVDPAWNDEPDWKDICGKFTTTLPYVACNMLDWQDVAAYLDWAGLRPMTEMEYEKVCRGPLPPVPYEYAWGNTTLVPATSIINSGQTNEAPGGPAWPIPPTTVPNCVVIGSGAKCVNGPMRVGCMWGMGTGSRTCMGAGYYGMRDLSGNLLEPVVAVGMPLCRRFTGQHGDGALDEDTGNANVPGWPDTDGYGEWYEGGRWVKITPTNSFNGGYHPHGFEGVSVRGGERNGGTVTPVSQRDHTLCQPGYHGCWANEDCPMMPSVYGGRGVRTVP